MEKFSSIRYSNKLQSCFKTGTWFVWLPHVSRPTVSFDHGVYSFHHKSLYIIKTPERTTSSSESVEPWWVYAMTQRQLNRGFHNWFCVRQLRKVGACARLCKVWNVCDFSTSLVPLIFMYFWSNRKGAWGFEDPSTTSNWWYLKSQFTVQFAQSQTLHWCDLVSVTNSKRRITVKKEAIEYKAVA